MIRSRVGTVLSRANRVREEPLWWEDKEEGDCNGKEDEDRDQPISL